MTNVIYKVTGQNKIFELTQFIWFRAKEEGSICKQHFPLISGNVMQSYRASVVESVCLGD